MPINDSPIHMPDGSQVVVPVLLTQDNLDGLCALIHYLAGVEASGKGAAPGSLELTTHYRQLVECVRKYYYTSDA